MGSGGNGDGGGVFRRPRHGNRPAELPNPGRCAAETDRDITYEAVPLDLVLGAVGGRARTAPRRARCLPQQPVRLGNGLTSPSRAVGRGLGAGRAQESILIGFAAREGTIAADGSGRNSPYTAALLSHIEQEGIEINKLFRLVRDKVMATTGGRQQPFIYGSTSSEDLFLKAPLAGAQPPPTASPEAVAADYGYGGQMDTEAGGTQILATHGGKSRQHLRRVRAGPARDKGDGAEGGGRHSLKISARTGEPACDGVRAKVGGKERCLNRRTHSAIVPIVLRWW